MENENNIILGTTLNSINWHELKIDAEKNYDKILLSTNDPSILQGAYDFNLLKINSFIEKIQETVAHANDFLNRENNLTHSFIGKHFKRLEIKLIIEYKEELSNIINKILKIQDKIEHYKIESKNYNEIIVNIVNKYKGLIDIDSEINRKKFILESITHEGELALGNLEKRYCENLQHLERNYNEKSVSYDNKLHSLDKRYKRLLDIYKKLKEEFASLKDDLEIIDYGIYEPVFNYESSEDYKIKIKENIEFQKKFIKEDKAALCETDWRCGGSVSAGRVMVKKQKKLMLRAINGECDALISKVRWNNYDMIYERMIRSLRKINELGDSLDISINEDYFNLKIEELKLNHEYNLKNYQEKEEERARRLELREEEKALREIEKERRRAEEEEKHYLKALRKIEKEIENTTGIKYEQLSEKLKFLQEELEDARKNKERAISMAQQTRRGYVYIISNIGSFGENVYKIGMTRRLDPKDRIKELSNASVPFGYDIHALLFSEDAPGLESMLHREFEKFRVNKVNGRKDFFNVPLEKIENKVRKSGIETEFLKIPEARDYRESLSEKKHQDTKSEHVEKGIQEEYYDSLFDYDEDE